MDFAKLRFPQRSLPDFFMAIVPALLKIQILKFCILLLFKDIATLLP